MSFDGIYIHYLIEEIKPKIVGLHPSKFISINSQKFVLSFNHQKLVCDLNSSRSAFYLSNQEFIVSQQTSVFHTLLRKSFEKSQITDMYQHQNDRVVIIAFTSFDELGYGKKRKLVLELFGRNSNALLLDDNDKIIDCYKRKMPSEDNDIIALPNILYDLQNSSLINPFETIEKGDTNIYQGISKLYFTEMVYSDCYTVRKNICPTLYIDKQTGKELFYCFPLTHLSQYDAITYPSLSSLLETFYERKDTTISYNNEQVKLSNYINHEISKVQNKLLKQNDEYSEAQRNLSYQTIGDILSANLHLIKKNMTEITVTNFYDNSEITIMLDPKLNGVQNLNNYYQKYKKAKRTIEHLEEQIEKTKKEIEYYQCLNEQLLLCKALDFKEIANELKPNKNVKIRKPNFTTYNIISGDTIFVGKNNLQNNYLTNSYAKKDDYFFHVEGHSGSHTILRTKNLTPENIKLAASIACYYSKAKNSSNVAVDYTLVKNIKKVKGTPGSFVTYSHHRTVFVTPDIEYIKSNIVNHRI